MEQLFVCESCQRTFPIIHRQVFEGQQFCENCLEAQTVVCVECEERIRREDNDGDADTPLCPDCFDAHYLICRGCGRVIHENEAHYVDDDDCEPYCDRCYERQQSVIHDYYYKPVPIFYGSGPRYMGVELEIDGAGESKTNAGTVAAVANRTHPLLYCKHDGSLDDGFELVTHPMSLEFHQQQMPWREVLEQAVKLGYTSHQARTCGLHVHISRDAFGETGREQDAVIARILYFFEKHWEELLKFSRRTHRQLERWADRYGYQEHPRDILDHAKKGGHAGRYACVNLENSDTVEFRIFRGTLRYNTLIATLQILDRICDVAICLSDEELKDLSWTTFVSSCTQPELVQYLKERRLYVNEPVETEVEI